MSDSSLLTDNHPVDPDDEVLVAYLDGELTDEERESVEKRLVKDLEFRTRLQALQSGWEWLDELPDVSPNEKLVESTIELVVADISPKKSGGGSWFWRNRAMLGMLALSVAGLSLGAVAMAINRRTAVRAELADIAIAEDLDAYLVGDDFDFFREVDADPQWRAMLEAVEVGGQAMATPSLVREVSLTERPDFLRELPLEDRKRLETKWSRFQRLSDEQKDAIRKTAASVSKQPDAERLLQTMKNLSEWREQLQDETKDALKSSDPTVRRKALQEAISATMDQLARRSGSVISDETADIIYLRLHQLMTQRLHSSPEIAAMHERAVSYWGDRAVADWITMRVMVEGFGRGRGPSFLSSRGRDSRPAGPPREPRSAGARTTQITDEELLDLTLLLDDNALRDLEALTNFPTQFEREAAVVLTLRTWASETLIRKAPRESDDRSLRERYVEREDRENLDLLPPDEFLDRVTSPRRFFDRGRSR